MKKILIILSVMILSAATSSKVSAALPARWSVQASSCIIDSRSLALADIYSQEGSVSFNSGQTGTIYLTCPVVPFRFGGTLCQGTLTLTAGAPGTSSVGAWLDYASITAPTGASTLKNVNAGSTTTSYSGTFATAVDFSSNYYWVNIALTRSSLSDLPKFWSVNIYVATVC